MTDDDKDWSELTKNIKKINKPEKVIYKKEIEIKVTPKITQNKIYQGSQLQELEIGEFRDVDANLASRFKNDNYRIEAELDLHGYTEDKAYNRVISFVKNAYLSKKRCIAIITGKGLHKNYEDNIFASRGVLKNLVPQWLNQTELRAMILAITHPKPEKGGEGVIKILLRRQRR